MNDGLMAQLSRTDCGLDPLPQLLEWMSAAGKAHKLMDYALDLIVVHPVKEYAGTLMRICYSRMDDVSIRRTARDIHQCFAALDEPDDERIATLTALSRDVVEFFEQHGGTGSSFRFDEIDDYIQLKKDLERLHDALARLILDA